MRNKSICIYHGGCDDGFGAAWVVHKAMGETTEFYYGVYQEPPPDVKGQNVILVDFSYKHEVIEQMAKEAKSLVILDHHKTTEEDLKIFKKHPFYNINVVFDNNRSGAAIAWDYFFNKPCPIFIEYLQDRDLWLKKLPYGDYFTSALRSYPQDFAVWDELVNKGVEPLIEEGKSIHRFFRLRVEEFKKSAYLAILGNQTCWLANAPYFAASEVAGELAGKDGLAMGTCYFEKEKNLFQYSLRSRSEYDVSEVAKQFGGGGHKNAAGFTTRGKVHRYLDEQ